MNKDISVFTPKHKKYFSTPRKMDEITYDLFNGDQWEANHFQNVHLLGRNLKMVEIGKPSKLHIVNYDYKEKEQMY